MATPRNDNGNADYSLTYCQHNPSMPIDALRRPQEEFQGKAHQKGNASLSDLLQTQKRTIKRKFGQLAGGAHRDHLCATGRLDLPSSQLNPTSSGTISHGLRYKIGENLLNLEAQLRRKLRSNALRFLRP
jgi:hypothetical protein